MARLPRLVVPGRAHLIAQLGHSGRAVFVDDDDRQAYLCALREAAALEAVAVHAYALADGEVLLLATPPTTVALSRFIQAVGRRYVSAYNRRHGGNGTLWEGRFRCGVIEPGHWLQAALRLVDGEPDMTSAGHRTGSARDPMVVDPPEFWSLGNTPFDREAAYRTLLAQGLPQNQASALRRAASGGWALGSPAFLAAVSAQTPRPLQPRPRGRPPKN